MRRAALGYLLLTAACGVTPGALDDDEAFEESPIEGVTCAPGAAACSGAGSVYAALLRVGRSATAFREVAQTFVPASAGYPANVTVKLRLLKNFAAGASSTLHVELRPAPGGVVPTDPAATLARADLAVPPLSRVRPQEVDLAFAPVGSPTSLVAGATYALVFRLDEPASGEAYVGVGVHASDVYAGGAASQRSAVAPGGAFPARAFGPPGGGSYDVSFSLQLASCADGVRNGTETGVDCGGSCGTCADGNACAGDGDCTSGYCGAGTCAPPPTFASCKAIRDAGYSTGSGTYTLDPDGSGPRAPFSAWCDMVTDGGGWTMLVNNNNADTEASGCIPRIGSDDSFVCGTVAASADFVVSAWGMAFSELVWGAYTGTFAVTSYQYMTWSAAQAIPHSTGVWMLTATQVMQTIPEWSAKPKIYCSYFALNTLRSVGNDLPASAEAYPTTSVVTVFDENANFADPGHMSFTDQATASATASRKGLDDFQDGHGCGDAWGPKSDRGYSSFIMIR